MNPNKIKENIEKDTLDSSVDVEYFDFEKNEDRIDGIPFRDNQKSLSCVDESINMINQKIEHDGNNEDIFRHLYNFIL